MRSKPEEAKAELLEKLVVRVRERLPAAEAVQAERFVRLYYAKVAPEDLLVVVDEVALPFGKLRARARGSAGGHNGLKSVIERLGTTEFSRLRLGVGRGDGRRELADHVLARFERGEQADLEALITRAADAAEMFAAEGISKVMNVYNADAPASADADASDVD